MQHRFKWFIGIPYIILNLFLVLSVKAGRLYADAESNHLAAGIWRGEIKRKDGHTIPFNFQTKLVARKIIIYVINGTERLLVDNVRRKGDSLFINMPFFDSRFDLRILGENKLEGNWIKNNGNRQAIVPFCATFNKAE